MSEEAEKNLIEMAARIREMREIIEREPLAAPTLHIDKSIHNFYDFTVDSFSVENYNHHPFDYKIPVAV